MTALVRSLLISSDKVSTARVAVGVPIVMGLSSGPVEAGLVASLARPGGYITGLTVNTGPEIETKRLELLKEAVPEALRIIFLGDKSDWEEPRGTSVRAAALSMGIHSFMPSTRAPTMLMLLL